MLMSRLDAYISRYGDFCAHDDNDNDTTDYFTPCACAWGNKQLLWHNLRLWQYLIRSFVQCYFLYLFPVLCDFNLVHIIIISYNVY